MEDFNSTFDDLNFDESGKAVWGTPGAGAYETVNSIGKTAVFRNAPDYSFGVRHKKNPFVSKQHDQNDYGGCDSPGECQRKGVKVAIDTLLPLRAILLPPLLRQHQT